MDLERIVRRWARRYLWQQSLRAAPFGLVAGLAIGVALAALARLAPLLRSEAVGAVAAALALVGLVAGAASPWLRHARTPTLAWARRFDRQFGLADRLSTALERPAGAAAATPELRALWALQRQDAERAAEGALGRTSRVLPLCFAWRAWAIALTLGSALVLLLLLPNHQEQVLAQRERERALVAEQFQQLEQARQAIVRSGLSPEQKARALEAIEQARQLLAASAESPEAALGAVNELRDRLRALQDENAARQAAQLQRATQSLAADELTRPLAEALARGDLEQAADRLSRLVTDRAPAERELTADEVDRLVRQLEQFARDVAETDPSLSRALRQAAQHLRRGEVQAARQALSEAARALRAAEQARQQQQALAEAIAHAELARRAAAQRAGALDAAQAGGAPPPAGERSSAADLPSAQPNAALPRGRGGVRSPDVGSDSSIWQPQRLQDEGAPIQLEDGGAEQARGAHGGARPAPEGGAAVPYQQVYPRYAQAADEAIRSGSIPPERRELVRRYFSALDPRQP